MEFTREDRKDVTVVSLKGEVDMRSSPELRAVLLKVAGQSVPKLAVNLEGVTYIDSSGIATLILCLKHVSQYGGRLLLIGVNEDIYPVFELAHLQDVFDLHRDMKID